MEDDPIQKYVLLVLFQAQNDHATELVISSEISENAPLKYKVEDTWYNLSAPPAQITPYITAELGRMAKLSEEVDTGIIDMKFSGRRLRWSAEAESGGRVFVLKPIPEQANGMEKNE